MRVRAVEIAQRSLESMLLLLEDHPVVDDARLPTVLDGDS